MKKEPLVAAIEQKAAEECAALLEQGKCRAAERRDALLSEARKNADALRAQAEARAEAMRRSARLTAGLEARKNTLRKKRDLLDRAYAEALNRLCSLNGEEWSALITRLIFEACPPGGAVLQVPSADAARYRSAPTGGKTLLETLEERLVKKHGVPCPLKLDSTPAAFRGGVLLRTEKSDIDASFEALLEDAREAGEQEVASLLFGEDEFSLPRASASPQREEEA